MIDTGYYNKDNELYKKLVDTLYENYHDGVRLTPEYASFVHENLMHLLIRLARYKFAARLIKKTDTVLEIGSGSGLGCIFLSQHCKSVTGIDVKSTEVEEARSINRRENAEFIVGDFFDLDENLKYDAIVALDVIEHLEEEVADRFVAKMARHLNPAGMAVIGTPSFYSYEYQSPLSKASHVKCYDQPELLAVIDGHFSRTLPFSMNDELVHTGNYKMAWYYFVLAFMPKESI